MSGKNGKGFGKLIVGAVLVGAAAYGIYKLSQRYCACRKEEGGPEPDEEKAAEPAAEETAREEAPLQEEAGCADEEGRYTSVDLKQAADRAYTTIQHGTQEAVDKVMEAVGPKGAGVIEVACETAGEVGKVVADSAVRIYDILTEPEETPAAEEAKESAEVVTEEGAEEEEEQDPAEEIVPAEAPEDEAPAWEIPEEAAAEEAEIETLSAAEETTIFAAEEAEEAAGAPIGESEEAVAVVAETAGETVEAAEEAVSAAAEAAGEAVTAAGETVTAAGEAASVAEETVEEFFDDEESTDA